MLTHHRDAAPPARTVVLGCRGFVGSWVLAHLEGAGRAAVGIPSTALDLTAAGAGEALAARLEPDDALVVVSALTPDRGRGAATLERNVRMGRMVAEAILARPPGHVVYVSSDAVYPDDAEFVSERTAMAPGSLHGAMHVVREAVLADACRGAGVPFASLRASLLYGPGDTHNGYGPNRFLRVAFGGEPIRLFGEGEERRDHVFVGDVARLVAATLDRRSAGVLNVATGVSTSFREVAEAVIEAVGADVPIEGSPRANPIVHRSFDLTASLSAFPRFAWTSLGDGLARAVAEWA